VKLVTALVLVPTAALLLLLLALPSGPEAVRAEVTPLAPYTLPPATPTTQAASAGLLSLTPAAPALAATSTPVPAPRPASATPLPSVCNLQGAEYHQAGDQTVVLSNFVMDLPQGEYMVATIIRSNTAQVQVCFTPDASVLQLDSTSGGEIARSARSSAAHSAFDAIVASVRAPFDASRGIRVPSLTSPPPGVQLPTLADISIRPPSTGDAGLVFLLSE
jgi:hypothetical protein